jgi:hypothetical protein
MTTLSDRLRDEILSCKDKRGIITKRAVVELAKNKRTALHRQFTWDRTQAAERHWLDRAGELIRQYVTITVVNRSVRFSSVAYVRDPKLPSNEGGYRNLEDFNRHDATQVVLAELQRCESAIIRARAICGVLDARHPGLSDHLENALGDLLAAKTLLLAA